MYVYSGHALSNTKLVHRLKETNISNEHNRLKNPHWREANQLAIYKHDQGVELGSTKKQLQLSGQSGTWTRDLRISSPAPKPLGHAASLLLFTLFSQKSFRLFVT